LLYLRFRVGHLADQNVAGGVNARFGFGIKHGSFSLARDGIFDGRFFDANPIFLRGGSGGLISWRIASKTAPNCESYFCSSFSSFAARPAFEASICRNWTNVRMIAILT